LSTDATAEEETTTIELPRSLVDEIEQIMRLKFERRPVSVSTSRYVSELLRYAIEKEQASQLFSQSLEEYSIEKDRIYIKDNERNVVAELSFKDLGDLYCNYDASKNCVHIGFALSIPAVQRIVAVHRNLPAKLGNT
jgi:hypothetical protein